MFTKSQEQVVKETYAFLTKKEDGTSMKEEEIDKEIIKPFYDNLFIRDESLRKYFKHLEATRCQFARALTGLIETLGNPNIDKAIISLAQRHIAYSKNDKFTMAHSTFKDIEEALVAAISSALIKKGYPGPSNMSEIDNSWRSVYNTIAEIMKSEIEISNE
ncbi:MAG: globin [Bacteroidota bacterium]